jgi:hypothetical protein
MCTNEPSAIADALNKVTDAAAPLMSNAGMITVGTNFGMDDMSMHADVSTFLADVAAVSTRIVTVIADVSSMIAVVLTARTDVSSSCTDASSSCTDVTSSRQFIGPVCKRLILNILG